MSGDTPDHADHARALEVLRNEYCYAFALNRDMQDALVALYAAAVRREEIGNGLDDMDIHSPEYKAFEQAWRDARRAYREALAAVPKAVLP